MCNEHVGNNSQTDPGLVFQAAQGATGLRQIRFFARVIAGIITTPIGAKTDRTVIRSCATWGGVQRMAVGRLHLSSEGAKSCIQAFAFAFLNSHEAAAQLCAQGFHHGGGQLVLEGKCSAPC